MTDPIAALPHVRVRGNAYQYDRSVPGRGRLRISLRLPTWPTPRLEEVQARIRLLEALIARRDFDLVKALGTGDLDWGATLEAFRMGDLTSAVRDLRKGAGTVETIRTAADRLLKITEGTARESTYQAHKARLNSLGDRIGWATPLTEVTTQVAQDFILAKDKPVKGNGRDPGPWKPRTQSVNRLLYQKVWRLAIDAEKEAAENEGRTPRLTLNPWTKVVVSKGSSPAVPLPEEEFRKVHAAMEGTPEFTIVALGFLLGLRISECRSLAWVAFRKVDDVWMVSIMPGGFRGWAFVPKSKRGYREIPVPPQMWAILETHRARVPGPLLFPREGDEAGRFLTAKQAGNLVERAFKVSGVPYGQYDGYTHHNGRHACATRLLREKVPLMTVAEILGDRPEVVAKTYAHLVPKDLADHALSAMEVAL